MITKRKAKALVRKIMKLMGILRGKLDWEVEFIEELKKILNNGKT